MKLLKKAGELKEKTVTTLRNEGAKPFLRKARNYLLKPFMTPPVLGPFPERTRAKTKEELLCITENQDIKRLNVLVQTKSDFFAIEKSILDLVLNFCSKNKYSLRFISRDEPLNAGLIKRALSATSDSCPALDFYFDNDSRLAPSIRKLEVSEGDVFLSCSEICDNIVLNSPLPRKKHLSISAKKSPRLLRLTSKTKLEEMERWINER